MCNASQWTVRRFPIRPGTSQRREGYHRDLVIRFKIKRRAENHPLLTAAKVSKKAIEQRNPGCGFLGNEIPDVVSLQKFKQQLPNRTIPTSNKPYWEKIAKSRGNRSNNMAASKKGQAGRSPLREIRNRLWAKDKFYWTLQCSQKAFLSTSKKHFSHSEIFVWLPHPLLPRLYRWTCKNFQRSTN